MGLAYPKWEKQRRAKPRELRADFSPLLLLMPDSPAMGHVGACQTTKEILGCSSYELQPCSFIVQAAMDTACMRSRRSHTHPRVPLAGFHDQSYCDARQSRNLAHEGERLEMRSQKAPHNAHRSALAEGAQTLEDCRLSGKTGITPPVLPNAMPPAAPIAVSLRGSSACERSASFRFGNSPAATAPFGAGVPRPLSGSTGSDWPKNAGYVPPAVSPLPKVLSQPPRTKSLACSSKQEIRGRTDSHLRCSLPTPASFQRSEPCRQQPSSAPAVIRKKGRASSIGGCDIGHRRWFGLCSSCGVCGAWC